MALSVNRLGDAMVAAVDAVEDKTSRTAVFRALAEAIITELQTNALVTVATTGTATAQTGTGTIA